MCIQGVLVNQLGRLVLQKSMESNPSNTTFTRGYDSVIRRMQSWMFLLYNLYNTHEFILHMTESYPRDLSSLLSTTQEVQHILFFFMSSSLYFMSSSLYFMSSSIYSMSSSLYFLSSSLYFMSSSLYFMSSSLYFLSSSLYFLSSSLYFMSSLYILCLPLYILFLLWSVIFV